MPLPDASARPPEAPPRVLIVGCGALGKELIALTRDLPNVDVTAVPAQLHNRPAKIADAVGAKIRAMGDAYDRIFVAYADCGTGGALDRMLTEEFGGIERIPGAHCYEFYSGSVEFARLMDEEPGTFFLTDFLARHFESLVWRGLGLDRYRELLPMYFGAYRRVVYLAQTDNPELDAMARAGAERLGLEYERRFTGLGPFAAVLAPATGVETAAGAADASVAAASSPAADASVAAAKAGASIKSGATGAIAHRPSALAGGIPVGPASGPDSGDRPIEDPAPRTVAAAEAPGLLLAPARPPTTQERHA